jgi:hypothetical protein
VLEDIDLDALRRIPQVSYYFRYPLHRRDFHDVRLWDRVYGYYATKPLYESLTTKRLVDQSSGYNGDIASLFVSAEARSLHEVRLLLTHIAPQDIVLPSGRRNWPVIRAAARDSILQMLTAIPAAQHYHVVPLTIR